MGAISLFLEGRYHIADEGTTQQQHTQQQVSHKQCWQSL